MARGSYSTPLTRTLTTHSVSLFPLSSNFGNTKPIMRPLAAHPSLFSGIHFLCYQSQFKKLNVATRSGFLFHYSVQAWHEFMKKYQRRAGLGSRKFHTDDGQPVSADK
jgi:hypothetical protein